MKAILYTRPDGGLTVSRPVINTHPPEEMTEEQALNRAMKDIPPEALDVLIVEESIIPTDRTFRNAWMSVDGSIAHDIEKCRDIVRDRIREVRAPQLNVLDVELMKAVESGDLAKQTEIAAQKQVLRDAPADPAIDKAMTPEELKQWLSP